MAIFDDHVYDQFDWYGKAIEPIIIPINSILPELPNELKVSDELILESALNNNTLRINNIKRKILRSYCVLNKINAEVSSDMWNLIVESYDFVFDDKLWISLEDMVVHGNPRITKKRDFIEESDALKAVGVEAISELQWCRAPIDRNKESMQNCYGLFECKGNIKKMTSAKSLVCSQLYAVIRENKWNIRNIELMEKIILWTKLHMLHNNAAAWINLCKVKTKYHISKGAPIYSIEEEPV